MSLFGLRTTLSLEDPLQTTLPVGLDAGLIEGLTQDAPPPEVIETPTRAHAAPTFFVMRDGLLREASTVSTLMQADVVYLHAGRFQQADATLDGTRLVVTTAERFPDLSIEVDTSASDASPMAFESARGTGLILAPLLPDLREGSAVDTGMVNGIPAQAALTGDSTTVFRVTLQKGTADFANAVGVYEVATDGSLVDARLLFSNADSMTGASEVVSSVEDGHRLGFFVVQDGADWAAALSATDSLEFRATSGGAGTLQDGSDLVLHAGGIATDHAVLHSLDPTLNPDGAQHALSGVAAGANVLTIGFEDLVGGGDRDYQDVLLTVTMDL